MNNEKKTGLFKRLLIGAMVGICCGIFAALTFLVAVKIGGGFEIVDAVNEARDIDDDEEASAVREDKKDKDDKAKKQKNRENEDLNKVVDKSVVTDVTSVVEDKMPSIVSINNNFTYNSFFYSADETATGSGIILDERDGELLIATNYHVVADNNSLSVVFCDDEEVEALVKGVDEEMDLAVVAVDVDDLEDSTLDAIEYATLGDSDELKVGEPVIAIGNALGYGQSVTTGVVSAINRKIDMGNTIGTFIQTDAAINPGNSGGALMNIKGDVIGINSNKIGGEMVDGMGYAIPISLAEPIFDELMKQDTPSKGSRRGSDYDDEDEAYLGISGGTITQEDMDKYDYPEGVYIVTVYDDTAAEEAGIQEGDIVTEFDGESVDSIEKLQRLIGECEAGDEVTIVVERETDDGMETVELEVELGCRGDVS